MPVFVFLEIDSFLTEDFWDGIFLLTLLLPLTIVFFVVSFSMTVLVGMVTPKVFGDAGTGVAVFSSLISTTVV